MQQSDTFKKWKDLYEAEKEQIMKDYFQLLQFQSISSENHPDGYSCAKYLDKYLQDMGLETQNWQTDTYPIIFAQSKVKDSNLPTILFYHHYDVQPVEPIDEWKSSPFEPSVREGKVYARGAQDNKGQLSYSLAALKAFLKAYPNPGFRIKLCIEGEEECGSPGLQKLALEKAKQLRADSMLIVDLGLASKDQASISLGVRGLVTMELKVRGSVSDLHSGSHGGLVYNPLHALCQCLAKMRDDKGRILVPGFYDDIAAGDGEELFSFDFDRKDYESEFGPAIGGELDFEAQKRRTIRPTLEINGLWGGHCGQGFKTVIPAYAHAKLSCRLVPGQEPQKIGSLVRDYFLSLLPKGLEAEFIVHEGGGRALRSSPDSSIAKIVKETYEELFASPCQYTLEGGSIPISVDLASASKADVLFMGYGLDSDQIHAPNEHFGLDRFEKGFLTIARILERFGQS